MDIFFKAFIRYKSEARLSAYALPTYPRAPMSDEVRRVVETWLLYGPRIHVYAYEQVDALLVGFGGDVSHGAFSEPAICLLCHVSKSVSILESSFMSAGSTELDSSPLCRADYHLVVSPRKHKLRAVYQKRIQLHLNAAHEVIRVATTTVPATRHIRRGVCAFVRAREIIE
ncbi:hypothetical protein BV25DRAFT_1840163 [Artomyces pyxidatus]|uniref:Uncharacterized protein n=1 Tax=Artomyces pyxidatus TaxID=48021 RepID=A0ACB8SV13_9AGAM|nr:hypothetical protein BV25DRAFT_1840163 [Artomyces pyxidatus]